nr:IclR family transcriptional regulator C-terminal domain-containing protein [Streptomyces tateyamensis]
MNPSPPAATTQRATPGRPCPGEGPGRARCGPTTRARAVKAGLRGCSRRRHYLRPISRIGRRLPAHATSLGKALLAERTEAEVHKLLGAPLTALTEHTLTDYDALTADLARTRERGYAVDHEENTLGLRCFGVAIRTEFPARDALSCSLPIARLTEVGEATIVHALLAARERLEASTSRR